MSTMARVPASASLCMARASAFFLRRRWPGSRPVRAARRGEAPRGGRSGRVRPSSGPRPPLGSPRPASPLRLAPAPLSCPAARCTGSPHSPRGSRARHPRGPGRGIADALAAAPLIFLFWFESAWRRLAKDPLRPPPSSRRPGGTGYLHPPHDLKAGFDSSKRVRGAARAPARPATAAAHSRRQPGASSELRGAQRPAQAPPLPVRSVHFLARWYESTPSAAGAAGHGPGPGPGGEPWAPVRAQEHPAPDRGCPGHSAPQAVGPCSRNASPVSPCP